MQITRLADKRKLLRGAELPSAIRIVVHSAINDPRHFARLLVVPLGVLIVVIGVFPLLVAVYLSFTNWSPNLGTLWWDARTFFWFQNYEEVILTDSTFAAALARTVAFTAVSVSVSFAVGFGLMLLLWKPFAGRRVVVSAVVMPMMVVPAVAGYSFFMLFQFNGPVNDLISRILARPIDINWLSEPKLALLVTVMLDVWQWTPFMLLVLMAAMAGVPGDQVDAARILGATPIQRLRHIMIPHMRLAIAVVLLIRSIEAVKTFDSVVILTGGGPGRSTELLSLYFFRQAFSNLRPSYAAAGSIIVFVVLVVIAIRATRLFARTEHA